MILSRAWFALMRRNLIYRRRNWIGTLLEIALPVCFVAMLVGIKNAVENNSGLEPSEVNYTIPTRKDAFTPLTFGDYVTAIQAQRQCRGDQSPPDMQITGMPEWGWNWQVPMVKCDPRNCDFTGQDAHTLCEYNIVVLAGTDPGGRARAADMKEWLLDRYPALKNEQGELPDTIDYELIQVFPNADELDSYVKHSDYGNTGRPKIAMGILFTGSDEDKYVYTLRQNSTNFNNAVEEGRPGTATTPDTKQKFESYARDDDSACEPLDGTADQGKLQNSCTGQYMFNGVLTFQRLVGDYILNRTGAVDAGYFVSEAGVQYVPFPTRAYEEEGFYGDISGFAPLLVTLGLLYPIASMIGFIAREKELRQKELMKMMSVGESDIGWSWFVSFLLFHFITASLAGYMTILLYENSDGFQLWIFWVFTMLAVITFSMALGSLTSRATRGILIGLLLTFAGFFLTLVADYDTGDSGTLSLISLHPIAAFSYGIQEIGRLEDLGIGVTSNTADSTDSPSGYTFSSALNSLIGDAILWGVITWYLNRVIQPEYGQALPLYFPFMPSYWFPGRSKPPLEVDDRSLAMTEGIPLEPVGEALARQAESGENIEIRGLCKQFGDKAAVDGLNLSMYKGQVTALLGHNGAGKTTTINMLTGAMAPTSGYAVVAGKDIRTQLDLIRQDIGICLQHDCLFPQLTVREHVQFFSRLKGLYSSVSHREAEQQVDQAIQDVALTEKTFTLSKNLSGGMKRKLSVAMAFCGGSKVVLLDEPTSGMDPFSRRFTWNVIRQYRQDRCIILTTHFMDEADILGDRIAIMAEGQLRCAGSSLFLKRAYGVGYQLTIEKLKGAKEDAGDELYKQPAEVRLEDNDDNLKDIVESAVPDATMLSNVGSEMSYQLPMGSVSHFAPMFKGLDDEVDSGRVSSYGVSITTLDEVFLLVARGDSKDRQEFASSKRGSSLAVVDDGAKSARSRMDLENEGLFFRHVGALFKKRAAFFRRDKKAWCCTTVLPSIFVLIGFIVFKYTGPERNLDPIALDLNDYNSGISSSPRNPIMYNSPGIDFTCQPADCSYKYNLDAVEETGESYYFCGEYARLDDENSTCSISESIAVANIEEDGAVATAEDVGTVAETSTALFENSDNEFKASQYGAIFFTHDQFSVTEVNNGTETVDYGDAVAEKCRGTEANYTNPDDCDRFEGVGVMIQYNFTALHVSPLFQTLADEALVKRAKEGTDSESEFSIQCEIAPLPITKTEEQFGEAEDAFTAWFLVVLSFPFIGGAFAAFIVSERESKAKHLQVVAGVEPTAYWISTFMWDTLNYQIPLWITIALMFIFDVGVLTTKSGGVFSGVFATLFLYGPASAAFAYCVSFGFKSPSMCFIVLMISGFLIGMGGPLAILILRIIGEDPGNPNQGLVDAANIVAWCLRWCPSFCLGWGVFAAINLETFKYLEEDPDITVWSTAVLFIEFWCLIVQTMFYLWLAVFLDIGSTNPRIMAGFQNVISIITFRWLCPDQSGGLGRMTIAPPEDDDVMNEQQRVLAGEANDDLIVVNQLTKVYADGKLAVNNLSLGIPHGECFGLLGINGAGKTTTMAMLTAEFPPTSGDATLAGFSVTHEPQKTRRRIGYCPQFDAHFTNLTGREHVELYASIKGVPTSFIKEAAAAKLAEVGLSESDSDRLSAGYSGGMKRRLSLACATIGQPQIVFLDECSTGVDPVARREIWGLISDMVSGGNVPDEERTSVILTTHSMEECEALCPRIGIMANGRLRCLGSAQHLKNKFGQGYQVELRTRVIDRQDSDYAAIASTLRATKGAVVSDEDVVAPVNADVVFFTLDEAVAGLGQVTGDEFLSAMLTPTDPTGYPVWKDASSDTGVELAELAAFAASELRMRKVHEFIVGHYPQHVLRERQDTKARYEVSSEGLRISSIFASIEANKQDLQLADYGVSQTSLEQVFNMHAAEAERLKQGARPSTSMPVVQVAAEPMHVAPTSAPVVQAQEKNTAEPTVVVRPDAPMAKDVDPEIDV